MGGGNRPVKDRRVTIRLGDDLRLVLEVIAAGQAFGNLSDTCRTLLESHPQVLAVRDKLATIDLSELSTGEDHRP